MAAKKKARNKARGSKEPELDTAPEAPDALADASQKETAAGSDDVEEEGETVEQAASRMPPVLAPEKGEQERELMHVFESDREAVFRLADEAGLSADERQEVQATLDAGVTLDEFEGLQRSLRTRAVRRVKAIEAAAEGRAGKYRTTKNILLGDDLVTPGTVVELDEAQSRDYMASGAVEPVL